MSSFYNSIPEPSTVKLNRDKISWGVLGVGFNQGQMKLGVDQGPDFLREYGLHSYLKTDNNSVYDFGNIENKDLRYHSADFSAYQLISECVEQFAMHAEKFLTLGGDHSISLGSIDGLLSLYPELCVIWLDAHGDMNSPASSPTGNLHGMPLAALMDLPGFEGNKSLSWKKNTLKKERVALIGVRDLDPREKEFVDKYNLCVYTAEDVKRFGMAQVTRWALGKINPENSRPIHLSFDIDAIDPGIAAATGVPVCGGLDMDDVKALAQFLALTERLVSLDFVEFNPLLASTKHELSSSVQVLFEFLTSFREVEEQQRQVSSVIEDNAGDREFLRLL